MSGEDGNKPEVQTKHMGKLKGAQVSYEPVKNKSWFKYISWHKKWEDGALRAEKRKRRETLARQKEEEERLKENKNKE